jgi:hypothetical protein
MAKDEQIKDEASRWNALCANLICDIIAIVTQMSLDPRSGRGAIGLAEKVGPVATGKQLR